MADLLMSRSPVTSPHFNNGEKTDLYFTFDIDEAKLQFTEIFVIELYKKARIKKDMTVIDVGAAMGLTSLYLKDYARKIYALEPNFEVYQSAVKNTEKYPNITCFNMGLAGSSGKGVLYGYNNAQASTSTVMDNVTSKLEIQIVALDKFMEDMKIAHVDLLKIDCEGMEYEIFSSESFKRVAHKIDYIIGEAHWQPPFYPMFIPEMLKEYGFVTEWLPHDNLFQQIAIKHADNILKTYTAGIQSMFFARRS